MSLYELSFFLNMVVIDGFYFLVVNFVVSVLAARESTVSFLEILKELQQCK